MWNKGYTIPTLIILAIITGAYLSRKRLPLKASRVFGSLLVVSLFTIVFDYASTIMDENGPAFAPIWLWLVNYVFFVLFLLRSYYLFWLPLELFGTDIPKREKNAFRVLETAEQAFLLFGSLNGWIYQIADGNYVSGCLYEFINLQMLVWMLTGLGRLFLMKSSAEIRKGGVYVYFAILLCGIVLRTLLPYVVIMNLFSLMAILVIYLMYMNPDQYLDDVSLLFNDRGWQKVLNEVPLHDHFGMVGFGLRNFNALRETREKDKLTAGIDRIGEWIRHTWPNRYWFFLENGIFIICDPKGMDREEALHQIEQRFSLPWTSESGDEYYLTVNEIQMGACGHHLNSSLLASTLWDVYPLLTQPEETEPIRVDEERVHKYLRKRDVQILLNNALEQNALAMFLQPVVRTLDEKVEGAEALCRLPDGRGGYVYPDEFIPLAKQNGSMNRLGIQMFEKACAFMSQEEVCFSNMQWINVNVAPEQFRNPNLLDQFLTILQKYHLDPSRIHLEITEETMIERTLLHESMAQFQTKGFVFAMDDFGSSYSNMIRLQQNHFSNVKIDRDFTWSYFREKTSLLPDIVTTCHHLGLKVVTEGVETKEMVDGVKEMDVDYIQGYYYSKPIPAESFQERFVIHQN